MEFTFGIITTNDAPFLRAMIDSIRAEKIPFYEIIIVGGNFSSYDSDIVHIPFDDSIKKNWITAKKNLICEKAKYENIVLMHDFVKILPGWYEGFLKFGNNFDICINKVLSLDNRRFRDYCLFPEALPSYFHQRALLPYDYNPPNHIRKVFYISGSYYVIKKTIALRFILDERLAHGNCEDVLLCLTLGLNDIYIQCNSFSSVKFLKEKPQASWEKIMNEEDIKHLESISEHYFAEYAKESIERITADLKSHGVL